MSRSFWACSSEAMAPSMKATSSSSRICLDFKTRTCVKSKIFFRSCQWSFIISVSTMVLSSQQEKENHPIFIFSLFMDQVPQIKCAVPEIALVTNHQNIFFNDFRNCGKFLRSINQRGANDLAVFHNNSTVRS